MSFTFNSDLVGGFAAVVAILTVIVHVVLAWGVWGDAHAVLLEKRWLFLAPPWLWALATLLTGVLGATSYWLINRSTLRPPDTKTP